MKEEEQLSMVIQRMRFIANSNNCGDIEVCYMTAFDALTELEKAVIVRHAVKTITGVKPDIIISDAGVTTKELQKERQEIIKSVVDEDKSLKYFIAKVTVVFAFIIIAVSMALGLEFFKISSNTLVEILKLVIGMTK